MNKLLHLKRVQILSMLSEGSPKRAAARVRNVSPNTVDKFLVSADLGCARSNDDAVRNVKAQRIQCDEI
jgi:hypothetical protein